MSPKKLSNILTIIGGVISLFAIVFAIIQIVACHNATAGITDEVVLAQTRQPYTKLILFVSCLPLVISMILFMVSAFIYVNNCNKSDEKKALYRIVLCFIPLAMVALILAVLWMVG